MGKIRTKKMPQDLAAAQAAHDRLVEIAWDLQQRADDLRARHERTGSNAAFADWQQAAGEAQVAWRRVQKAKDHVEQVLREMRSRRPRPRKVVPVCEIGGFDAFTH